MEYSTSEYSTFHLFVTVALGRGGGRAPPNSPVEFMRIIPRWNIPHKFHCDFFWNIPRWNMRCAVLPLFMRNIFFYVICVEQKICPLWNIPLWNIPLRWNSRGIFHSGIFHSGIFHSGIFHSYYNIPHWNIPHWFHSGPSACGGGLGHAHFAIGIFHV